MDYEVVIGLEVHAELATRSKIFCGCATAFGAPPNTQVCPVCLGLPGSLPVLNHQVLSLGLRAALALEAAVASETKFDRKNYFYPDLPKAYQISQYDLPLAENGRLEIELPGGSKTIRVKRIHMEEDAGKLLHLGQGGRIGAATGSLVDYNRAGVPLIEIVSEPDLRSAEEAHAYLTALKEILRYADISDCNMEEGSLRCDANISLRPRGETRLGTKAEIKNMNSFKNVRAALEYEAGRQAQILNSGGSLRQETRLWDPEKGVSTPMRHKEEAHDYRYFPEPDLPLLRLPAELVAASRAALPELPKARRERLQRLPGLTAYDAGVLASQKELADYFERAASGGVPAKAVCNWLTVELLGKLNAEGKTILESPVQPAQLNQLVGRIESGEISGKMGKQVFAEMMRTGEDPEAVIRRLGLKQISDAGEIEKLVEEALAGHPSAAAEVRAGKAQALGFLVGQVMKASQGRANPKAVNEMLKKRLE